MLWCNCDHCDNIENINISNDEIKCNFCSQKVDKIKAINLLQKKIEDIEYDFREEIILLKEEVEKNSIEREDRENKKVEKIKQEVKVKSERIARFSLLDIREEENEDRYNGNVF